MNFFVVFEYDNVMTLGLISSHPMHAIVGENLITNLLQLNFF